MSTYLLESREQEVEIEGERGDEVDDVDRCAEERQLVGADDEANQQLEREPAVAHRLHVEEGVVHDCLCPFVCLSVLHKPSTYRYG